MKTVEHARAAFAQRRLNVRAFVIQGLAPTCAIAIVWAAFYASRVTAQEPAKLVATADRSSVSSIASPDEISRWIDELGHEAFTVRQAAASRLLAAGMSAREPLRAIADGPDPETRAAARRLVALIDQSEFHRRLEAFAADTDGHQGLTLPGWDQFQKLVGGDPPARALFVDMQRQEGALLSAMFGATKRGSGDLLQSRLVRLIQWQNIVNNRTSAPSLGSSAALLFLGSLAEIQVSDESAMLIENLLQRPPILETLRTDNRQDAVRRLAVAWLIHCPAKNEEVLRQRLSIISSMGLEEALPLPLAVIGGEQPYQRVHSNTRALAALLVGQLGRREHIERLEPLLDDVSNCNPFQQQLPGQPNVQVRDVALVVMLQLTDQRPADYGYVNARVQPPKIYQIQTLFRENDQQRTEAIAKWRQWRADQKNAPAPATPK